MLTPRLRVCVHCNFQAHKGLVNYRRRGDDQGMRARPNPSGERLVTDYLTRVAEQARLLPKGVRMAFVGRTRALIERELAGRTDPAHVSAVLERLGRPEDLVMEERTRIDRGWVKSRASSEEAGEAAAAALTGPLNRSLTPRRRPGADTQPGKRTPPGGPGTGPVTPVEGTPVARPPGAGPRRPGPRSTSLRGAGPRSAGLRSVGPRSSGPRSGALRSADSPGAGAGRKEASPGAPPGTGPPGTRPGSTGRTGPSSRLTGKAGRGRGLSRNETLAQAGQLARDNLLETIAILLLGLGGLILPFPFWPVGAIVALFSRLWDMKDKSVAIAGPLLVALAGSVLGALIIGGSGNVIVVYSHALRVDFGLLIRVGAVLTAAYLAWRVTRGPRVKVPPWRRIKRS
jgi:hypothetical protein